MDLSLGLLDDIHLVFAASTGDFTQLNQIKSWNFTTIENVGRGHGRKGAFGSYCLDYIFPLFVRCALHVEKVDTAEKARLPQPGENDRRTWSSQI
jgi:hypothetical protein